MLQFLKIRNLALLEEVALEFEAGFTAVTGETGAGKSILLGALSLLAGERADKTIIRQGAAACEVEAALHFRDPAKIDAVLAELGLPACADGQLLLKRSLAREKPPRITVNGSLATLAALQRLGELWIDFHGPSEPRRLLREDCQLDLLDLFGRAGEVRGRLRGGLPGLAGTSRGARGTCAQEAGCRPTSSNSCATGWRGSRRWTWSRRRSRPSSATARASAAPRSCSN